MRTDGNYDWYVANPKLSAHVLAWTGSALCGFDARMWYDAKEENEKCKRCLKALK